SIVKVTQGMTVTLEQANRDLERRIGEFQAGIKKAIGADAFNAMTEQQQAVLTSIAYNYGSLPDRIIKAIATGDAGAVYTAIKGLSNDG
ncbi:glycoside hydrolase family protein, partial [Listeria monocytogenes]|uniref:glycoside hydrolase family protein n=1 Tax=Listeria monocytogenes TaxID=1639 RepID=UPI002FDC513F